MSILGIPETVYSRKKSSKKVSSTHSKTAENQNPRVSKIGGNPIWHDPDSAPVLTDLVCGLCQQNEDIVLVCQIYAPIDDLDRSLYILACNRRQCSLSSRGWIVVRNQKLITSVESVVPVTEKVKKEEETGSGTPKKSIWDFSSINLNSTPAKSNADDLAAMLAQRDSLLKSKPSASKDKKKKTVAPSPSKSEKKPPTSIDNKIDENVSYINITEGSRKSLPEHILVEVDDPYLERSDRNDAGNNMKSPAVDVDDEEEDEEEEFNLNNAIDDSHIQQLLENYMKDEDDVESLQIIRQYQSGNLTSVARSSGKEEDREILTEEQEDRFIAAITRSTRKSSTPSSASKSQDANNNEEPEDEKDFKDQNSKDMIQLQRRRKQVERSFHKRIALEPYQVLRYCYQSHPIWITYPHPSEKELSFLVPPCPTCGLQRVYECQLMPPLLSFISSDSYSIAKPESKDVLLEQVDQVIGTNINLQEDLARRLGDSLDFGVVTIWSCPNSCPVKEGIGMAIEVAVVQPPPDI